MSDMITVSTRGRIVIPKKIRDELGFGPGRRLLISMENGEIVLEKPEKAFGDFDSNDR